MEYNFNIYLFIFYLIYKMAKEMNVKCNFVDNTLTCELPEHTMDVLLKVRTKLGEHTFREDIYTGTLKYRRWNNELRPFQSLKRRVANMFWKRGLISDDSRGTSMQTVINQMEREEESELCSDGRESINSDQSELLSVSRKVKYKQCNDVVEATTSTAGNTATQSCAPPLKRTIKNIVLVPYMPKPKDWEVGV